MTEEDPGFAALVATISSETALALVGAGSSARVGYSVWSQLADALRAEALRARPDDARRIEALARSDSDPLFLAGEYREMLGPSKYEEFIERTFGPDVTNVTQFHADLVRLPFKHVLTTNYDAVLENAHQQVFPDVPERVMWGVAQEAAAFLAELSKPSQRRKYVYLHGRYNQPASVVLTEEDYQRRYVQSSDAGARDFAVFATHPIVFIGFSGQDLDVMNRFRQVRAQGATQPRHIALLPLESDADPDIKARQLAAKYGVRPVF